MKHFANLFVVLLAISLCLPVVAQAQETTVTVPDENLAAELRFYLDLGANDPITQEALEDFTRFILSDEDITDLTGLEYATNLASLDLGENNISDLTPLSDLSSLTELDLADNSIIDVTPLAGLSNLTTLYLAGNDNLTDFSPLLSLTALQTVDVDFSALWMPNAALRSMVSRALKLSEGEYFTVAKMADLTAFAVVYTSLVTDLTGLEYATNLTTLFINGITAGGFTDLSPIEGLTGITKFTLAGAQVSDLTPLSDMVNMENLNLQQNGDNISDITPLKDMVNLKELNLYQNNISDLSPLKDMEDLESLYLSENNVADISPLEGLVSLKTLSIRYNDIGDVSPLAGLSGLNNLYLEGNPIVDTSPLYPLTLVNLTRVDIDILQYPAVDVNQDGSVDSIDVGLVVSALGQVGDGIANPRTDVNGDGSVDSADLMLIDDEGPEVTVSVPSVAQNGAFDITIVFSEAVSGFEQGEISLSDNTASASVSALTTEDNISYTATITPTTSGDVVVSIPADVATDAAGNANTASATHTVTVDMIAPTVIVSVPVPAQNGAFEVGFTFSEAVSGFEAADILLATDSLVTVTDLDTTNYIRYYATLTPTASGDVVLSIPADAVADAAGNANNVPSQTYTIKVDMILPTVTVSAPTVVQNGAFEVTITFSEAVSGFEAADVSLSGSRAGVTDLSTTDHIKFYATLTPTASGDVVVSIPADVAVDVAGNANTASATHTITVDVDVPSVAVSAPTVVQNGAFDITMTFSEAVSGFDESDISLSDSPATVTDLSTTDHIKFYATLTPFANGDVVVSIPADVATDAAGNANTASETHTVTVDMIAPTVTVSAPTVAQSGAFDITMTFSEAVSGFDESDVSLANNTATASVGALTTEDNITYTTTITPTTSGTVSLSVPAGMATDAAGNANTASATHTITVSIPDPPSVTVSAPTVAQSGAFDITMTFSEAVSGFDQADVSLANSTATASVGALTTEDNITYTTTVTPTTSGDVVISIPADVATNGTSQTNTASATHTVTVDMDAPSVTVSAPTVAQSGAFDVTITFSEAVSGFDQADVSLANNTASASVSALTTEDNITYTTTVTPTTSGDVVISIPADVATDAASQMNTASGTHTVTVDMDAPTVSISTPRDEWNGRVTQSGAFEVTITFSEAVSGFEAADVSLEGSSAPATVTSLDTSDDITYTATITPTASGAVYVSILEGVATDSAGNLNTAVDTQTVAVSIAGGDTVDIPDTQLATILRWDLNLAADQPITTEGLKGLIWLDADISSIRDLTGLEHATNLTRGFVTRNSISDISALAELTNLTELYLSDNDISDISALAGLTNLTELEISDNNISDISPLAELTNLVKLYLSDNDISDISALAELTNLLALRLRNNSISDVSDLAGLTNIWWLWISGNPILDTSPIFPLLEANGGAIVSHFIDIEVSQYPPWDVNEDGSVNATDSSLVTAALGQSGEDIVNPRTDVDSDGDVDNDDLLLVTSNLEEEVEEADALAPVLLDSAALRNLSPAALEARLAALRAESDGSLKYLRAIALLEAFLAEIRPDKTVLLTNYPNPFNPETWIPYHLANATDVQITIYDARGSVVRRLALGHQTAGYYTSRSRAAYWDGSNEVGERVASGIYFYQLEADNLSFLRKMLILK